MLCSVEARAHTKNTPHKHDTHKTTQNKPKRKVNQTFTIEPIFSEGTSGKVRYWDDEWTAVMADGGLAAQWEHTVLITPDGHEILTPLPE